ncbi:Cdc6/Cdc18 family protein [Haloarcula sp. JP-L23]|uniref:Cdc6/Cdc18 family protein n=1 Tax=Haloarcula sp. JP-L23 TaxID=2716717 RepID=UPI00140F3CC8|nr:AAA family ATPase [Haloarcula sp. JP-L23]
MGLEPFSPDSTIFRDESVLRDGYQPQRLIERDTELEQYQSALKPVINGAPPKNLFLYGQTGVGKTLSSRMVMDRLAEDQEEFDSVEVHVVSLNCKSLNSSYQVAANLINQFRPADDQIKPTGYPSGMIYNMLFEELDALDVTHCLIVLDEIDSIGNDDDILYKLPRANDNNNVENTFVGVIGISNDFTFRDSLSARVKDSLCDEEIHFPPYDANELGNILKQRAAEAFHDTSATRRDDGVYELESEILEDDVIPLCAAFAAQDSGSARQALKRLYKAGDLARDKEAEQITEAHVREADEIVERDKVREELTRLPTQSKLTLYGLLLLEQENEAPAKRSKIYERYVTAAKRIDADVRTDRTIHDCLSQLTLKGFLEVTEQNKGPKGGSYYEYEFSIRASLAQESLREDDRLSELFGESETTTLDSF